MLQKGELQCTLHLFWSFLPASGYQWRVASYIANQHLVRMPFPILTRVIKIAISW
jgi:hypothetical protein